MTNVSVSWFQVSIVLQGPGANVRRPTLTNGRSAIGQQLLVNDQAPLSHCSIPKGRPSDFAWDWMVLDKLCENAIFPFAFSFLRGRACVSRVGPAMAAWGGVALETELKPTKPSESVRQIFRICLYTCSKFTFWRAPIMRPFIVVQNSSFLKGNQKAHNRGAPKSEFRARMSADPEILSDAFRQFYYQLFLKTTFLMQMWNFKSILNFKLN